MRIILRIYLILGIIACIIISYGFIRYLLKDVEERTILKEEMIDFNTNAVGTITLSSEDHSTYIDPNDFYIEAVYEIIDINIDIKNSNIDDLYNESLKYYYGNIVVIQNILH